MIDDAGTLRLCSLLCVVIDELRGLRADLAGRKRSNGTQRVLSADDARMLGALLPQIVATIGAESFTVRRLREAAQARTHAAKTLRAALDATGMNALQIGRLFRRAAESEMSVANLYVHRLGQLRAGAMYCACAESRESRLATSFANSMQGKITP